MQWPKYTDWHTTEVVIEYLKDMIFLIGWLFGFYGISTFVGYLLPNPFLYK